MSDFIEVTVPGGEKVLLNVRHISAVDTWGLTDGANARITICHFKKDDIMWERLCVIESYESLVRRITVTGADRHDLVT